MLKNQAHLCMNRVWGAVFFLAASVGVLAQAGGSPMAFGDGSYGQLGNGHFGYNDLPAQVDGITGVTAIGAGYDYSLALKNDGTVWGWGSNRFGQLGQGSATPPEAQFPLQVQGLAGVMAIAAGGWHALALKSDGTLWAWGYNFAGELGNGTSGTGTDSAVPVRPGMTYGTTGISGTASSTAW